MKKKFCRWYDETSAIKRAYDEGKVDRKWIENYCWNEGKNCLRKKKFEGEGYVSQDYVMPDGSINEKLKKGRKGGYI